MGANPHLKAGCPQAPAPTVDREATAWGMKGKVGVSSRGKWLSSGLPMHICSPHCYLFIWAALGGGERWCSQSQIKSWLPGALAPASPPISNGYTFTQIIVNIPSLGPTFLSHFSLLLLTASLLPRSTQFSPRGYLCSSLILVEIIFFFFSLPFFQLIFFLSHILQAT